MGIIKKISHKFVATKNAVKDNVSRKKSVLSFLWKDARGQLNEMGSALNREPEVLTFEEVSRRWKIDPFSDAPDRAARLNLGMAIFFLTVCVWCLVQLADGLSELRMTASIASAIACFASFTVGVASLWRWQIFSHRRYLPFFQWFKRGGTLFAGLILAGAVLASAMDPNVSQAEIDIDLPKNVEIQKDNDISAAIFQRLLGETWTRIAGSKGAKITTGGNPYAELIVAVLGTLNVAALTYLSILIMYMWGIFTVSTAHEGKKLGGGVYNSLWVPARHALSFSMTVPVFKGLSLLQVAIFACLGLSINLANNIWDAASKFISENTSQIFSQMSNNLSDESVKMISGMYDASVFQLIAESNKQIADNATDPNNRTINDYPKAYNSIEAPTDEIGNPVCDKETNKGGYVTIITCGSGIDKKIEIFGTPTRGLDKTTLGYVVLTSSDSKSTTVLDARKDAILKMWDDTRAHAKNYLISNDSLQAATGYHAGMNKVSTKDYATIMNEYSTSVREKSSDTIKSYMLTDKDLQNKISKSIDYEKDVGSRFGWITAGMHSYNLAALQKKIDDLSYSKIDYTPPDSKKLKEVAKKQWDVDSRAAYSNSNEYFANKITTNVNYSSAVLAEKDPNIIEKPILSIAKTLILNSKSLDATKVGITGSVLDAFSQGEPMVPIQAMGDRLINGGFIALGASVAMNVGGSVISKFGGPLGDIINSVSSHFLGIMVIFGVAMVIAGIMMAYIMPITPLIIWLRALVTWVFQVIESLVAAPFWACVHAMPKGEGFAGDQARQGYYLLMEITIRPVLLTFGAICIIAVMRVLGWLYYVLFSLWFKNATAYLDIGVTADLVFTVVVISTMYILIITVSTLGIVFFVDRIMKWLNSSASSLGAGENDTHQKVNQIVGMFNSTGSQALGGMRALGGQSKGLPAGGGGDKPDQGGGGGGGDLPKHIAKKGGEAGAGAASAAGSSAAGAGGGAEGAGKQIASKSEVQGGGQDQKGSEGSGSSNSNPIPGSPDIGEMSPKAMAGGDPETNKKKLKLAGDAISGGGGGAAGGAASQIGGKLG